MRARDGSTAEIGRPPPRRRLITAQAKWIDGEQRYPVASIDDLIAMKNYAGRPRDIGQVELLRELSRLEAARETKSS